MLSFYASKGDELVAVRRAAARAGCNLARVNVEPARLVVMAGATALDEGDGDPAVVGALVCRDGWQAARLLLALAIEDARTPGAVRIASELRELAPADDDFARAVHAYVLSRVRFVREQGEIFQSGAVTLGRAAGDCDDMFRLVYALAVAGGLEAKLAILHHGTTVPPAMRGPTHAVAMLCPGGSCAWAETTVRATYGENPNDAALRLGLTNERSDIAKEVFLMSESDLPPLPDGFRERNDPTQVALDAAALQRLGFLDEDAEVSTMTDPTLPELRGAVADFQRAHGLVVDGLLGSTTRLTIARALKAAGSEGFDYPGLSGLGDDVPVKLTADLTDAFLLFVIAMAGRFRALGALTTVDDWLRVWTFESGINSHRPNGAGAPYGGLNQMGVNEQRAAGFLGTMADWLSLSNEEQVPFVERFYLNAVRNGAGGDFSALVDAGSVYVATFAPAFLGSARGNGAARLYSAPSAQYEANKVFDRDGKGFITPDDLRASVAPFDNQARFREVKARVAALGGELRAASSGGIGGAGLALALFAAGGALAWWMTRT